VSVVSIVAKFECDRCGERFTLDIDPASNGNTAFAIAQATLADELWCTHKDNQDICRQCLREDDDA